MKALVIAEHPEAARELAAGARTLADEVALVAFGEAPENVADAAYIVEVPEGAVWAAAHEDINCITLLPEASDPGLQLLRRDGTWLDINPEGVSKGSALELIRRRIGVEPVHTIAVGDQRNDFEMLRWAARGVAMGNAPDEVKAVADEVTGDVDDDGLVDVLTSLL